MTRRFAIKMWMAKREIESEYILAEKAGISTKTMSRIMNNENVTMRTLSKLADALDVDLTELLKGR